MKKRKITAGLLVLVMALLILAGCGEKKTVNAAVLKGPTGMGAIYLMDDAANGKTKTAFNITAASAVDEITGKLISGELDIAAVPTNLAAVLYNKSAGEIQVMAVNTLGVLYILDSTGEIGSMADLAGKTIYASGQSANPEYILNFVLRGAGLEPGKDVFIEWSATHDELAALMAAGEAPIAMLPEPFVSSVMAKNSQFSIAVDMTQAYEEAADGVTLAMGCIVARKDFISENPKAAEEFLSGWKASVEKVKADYAAAAPLIAQYGITGSEAIALKALPNSSLTYIDGQEMRTILSLGYQMLFDADPASVGGKLPDEGIYAG